ENGGDDKGVVLVAEERPAQLVRSVPDEDGNSGGVAQARARKTVVERAVRTSVQKRPEAMPVQRFHAAARDDKMKQDLQAITPASHAFRSGQRLKSVPWRDSGRAAPAAGRRGAPGRGRFPPRCAASVSGCPFPRASGRRSAVPPARRTAPRPEWRESRNRNRG